MKYIFLILAILITILANCFIWIRGDLIVGILLIISSILLMLYGMKLEEILKQ